MADQDTIFDITADKTLDARLDAEAETAYAAGRVVEHQKVVEWLKSWGQPHELPYPVPGQV